MLLIEIILTVFAWRRGYKAYALLPVGMAMAIGFLIGFISPESITDSSLLSFAWIDIFAIIALVFMIAFKPKVTEECDAEKTSDAELNTANESATGFLPENKLSDN